MPFFKRKRNAVVEEYPSAIGEKKAAPKRKAAKGEFIEVATNNIKEIVSIYLLTSCFPRFSSICQRNIPLICTVPTTGS